MVTTDHPLTCAFRTLALVARARGGQHGGLWCHSTRCAARLAWRHGDLRSGPDSLHAAGSPMQGRGPASRACDSCERDSPRTRASEPAEPRSAELIAQRAGHTCRGLHLHVVGAGRDGIDVDRSTAIATDWPLLHLADARERFSTAALTFSFSAAFPFGQPGPRRCAPCAIFGIGPLRFPGSANDFLASYSGP